MHSWVSVASYVFFCVRVYLNEKCPPIGVRRLPHRFVSVPVTLWKWLVWVNVTVTELRGKSRLALDSVREGMPGARSVGAGPEGEGGSKRSREASG